MKYIQKYNKFYNSTKTNEYCPTTGWAYSYTWYQYAHNLNNVLYIAVMDETGKKYSVTTGKHVRELQKFLAYPEIVSIYAPKGIGYINVSLKEGYERLATLNGKKHEAFKQLLANTEAYLQAVIDKAKVSA